MAEEKSTHQSLSCYLAAKKAQKAQERTLTESDQPMRLLRVLAATKDRLRDGNDESQATPAAELRRVSHQP